MDAIDAYCIKCKSKVVIKDPEEVKMQNGRPAIRGQCPKCGTKIHLQKSI
jgi:RNase P subunit RPR2